MPESLLHSKIELLQEQLDNYENSGRFTEIEIKRLSDPIIYELEMIQKQIKSLQETNSLQIQ